MPNPLVSVVLPTYKRPDKLRSAARSVADQTYSNIELIVVDDHSPQPAADTLAGESLKGIEINCVRHQENRGANQARNTGIQRADGEYIALLDDDDEWDPEKIARQASEMEESADSVGVVYTGCEYDYGDYTREVIFTTEGNVTKELLLGESFGEFSTLMVATDIIPQAGLPDERFPSWQDREWLIRLSLHAEFRVIPKALTRRDCPQGTDRISNNYTEKRDTSYPLMVEKHRALAARYGRKYERAFLASLLFILGQEALRARAYSDARTQLLKSVYYWPFRTDRWMFALAALGGRFSYKPAKSAMKTLNSVKNEAITK
ncbi:MULTISPECIES: glycosyltransferase family 2 protein [unclassified Haloarcula]|uniref:glycosyltransferase family 2 protein n=1 Tax=unclassified Haloarcula TaxID=2624677 RepID=UPI0017817F44|nr:MULTISPECIES: glycosyltransferase family 2 protein [unclassified Haloarcula]